VCVIEVAEAVKPAAWRASTDAEVGVKSERSDARQATARRFAKNMVLSVELPLALADWLVGTENDRPGIGVE
jgi:hypothetical protein